MIGASMKAIALYYKPYEDGYLFVIRLKKSKRHAAVDKMLQEVDLELQKHTMAAYTSFRSISDVLSCKIKSFAGNDRLDDYHFREIFDVSLPKNNGEYQLRENAKVWYASEKDQRDTGKKRGPPSSDDEDHTNTQTKDQRQTYEQDPYREFTLRILDAGSKKDNERYKDMQARLDQSLQENAALRERHIILTEKHSLQATKLGKTKAKLTKLREEHSLQRELLKQAEDLATMEATKGENLTLLAESLKEELKNLKESSTLRENAAHVDLNTLREQNAATQAQNQLLMDEVRRLRNTYEPPHGL